MANKNITYYIDRLNEIYEGEPWVGETLTVKLEDITDETAFKRPLKNVHAVAELVAHMIYWRNLLVNHLEGDRQYKASVESKENWLPLETLQQQGWAAIKKQLQTSQEKLTRLLSRQPDNFLQEEYSDGYTYQYLTEGIIDHDIYHIGQIGLVKRMLSGK